MKYTKTVLRVGLGITFLWIGALILQNPEAWGGFIQPWAKNLMPVSVVTAMRGTGILDLLIGMMLISNALVWVAALVGAIHLVMVLATTGLNPVTVRDIGLLGAAIALTMMTWPKKSQ